MEDESIVDLYWAKDEQAIQATQDKYGRYLTRIARNILSDAEDAQESVNDTYLAAWNSMPPHRPAVLQTYLGKLTRRISIDLFRRRTRQKRGGSEYALSLSELAGCVTDGNTPEDTLETKLLAQCINGFLRDLPETERNLFVGRYYFMDPLKETARYCGMSESKAKSMLFRVRCRLREYLQKEGFAV